MMQRHDRAKRDLWVSLHQYHFQHLVPPGLLDQVTALFGGADASAKAFAHKLARKLGWTTDFALRSVGEYKKFVFLGVVGDFNVTPSKVIDQVWHEHLLFTQAYPKFCDEVLGQYFHHNPELVADDSQTGVFQAQYHATLDLYRHEFNAEPPADIWNTPKFDKDAVKEAQSPVGSVRPIAPPVRDGSDAPLWTHFSDSHSDVSVFAGFGGGESGGGGASAFWTASTSSAEADSNSSDSSSSSSSESGDSGSSCSSGCGGGGD